MYIEFVNGYCDGSFGMAEMLIESKIEELYNCGFKAHEATLCELINLIMEV
jgi:hypothetical protein